MPLLLWEMWYSQLTTGNRRKNQELIIRDFGKADLTISQIYRLQTNVLSGTLLALLLLPRMLETAEKHNTTPRLAVVTSGLHYSVSFDEKFVKEPNFLRRYAHKDFRRYFVYFLRSLEFRHPHSVHSGLAQWMYGSTVRQNVSVPLLIFMIMAYPKYSNQSTERPLRPRPE